MKKTYKLLKYIDNDSIWLWETFEANENIKLNDWNTIPATRLIKEWYIEEVEKYDNIDEIIDKIEKYMEYKWTWIVLTSYPAQYPKYSREDIRTILSQYFNTISQIISLSHTIINLTIEEVRYYMYLEMTEVLSKFVKDKIKKWEELDDNSMELRHIIYNKIESSNMLEKMNPSELYNKMWIKMW